MGVTSQDAAVRGHRLFALDELLRSMTQEQISRLAGLPRATWANLESGTANPTLTVLQRVAMVFQVSIEELLASPRAGARHYPRGALPTRARGAVELRSLLPDPIPGMIIERMELPPGPTGCGDGGSCSRSATRGTSSRSERGTRRSCPRRGSVRLPG